MSDTNRRTLQTYDAHAQRYFDRTIQSVEGPLKEWIDHSLLALDKSARILEVGAAFGRDADYMESKGFNVERTDASISFVEYLRSRGHTARPLNVITDPLGSGYDMVFANAVAHHFTRDELMHVAHKVFYALKADGRFAFTIKAGNSEEWLLEKLDAPRYFCYWQEEDLRMLLRMAGFKHVESRAMDHYRPNERQFLLVNAFKQRKENAA